MKRTFPLLPFFAVIAMLSLLVACGGGGGSSDDDDSSSSDNNNDNTGGGTQLPSETVSFTLGGSAVKFNDNGQMTSSPTLNTATPELNFSLATKSSGTASEQQGDIDITINCLGGNNNCSFQKVSMKLLEIVYTDTGSETSLAFPTTYTDANKKIKATLIEYDQTGVEADVTNTTPFTISGHEIKVDTQTLTTLVNNRFGKAYDPLFKNSEYSMELTIPSVIPLSVRKLSGNFTIAAN